MGEDRGPETPEGSGWQWNPNDTDRYASKSEEDPLGQDVATAPGDLPIKLVVERERARAHQFRHDNTINPLSPMPNRGVEVLAESGSELKLTGARIFYAVDGTQPDASSTSVDMALESREWSVLPAYTTRWRGTIPAHPAGTVIRYRIGGWTREVDDGEPDCWAQDGQGFWFRFAATTGLTTFAYSVEEPAPPAPDWVRDGVIYHVFLDRFRPSDQDDEFKDTGFRGFHGGTLEGVRRSLPYLHNLGVTCVWLSPLHPAETYHRYDGMDYNDVDPALGTQDDFRRLTREGAETDIRFWMDFVPSHLSWHHPAFLDAQRDRNSPSASWFTFYHHPDRYRTFLDLAPFLPSINTDDPGARQHLIDSAVRWLTEFDVSGFRLDHAIGPSMDFWTAFRQATKGARPDSFTVGEATDTPDSLRRFRQRLDAILDFPLARALRSTFGLAAWNVEQLESFLGAYEAFMETGPYRVSFLDNHDMDRFLFVAGGDVNRLKLAALCQFALAATPVIYYGTEIALPQNYASSDQQHGGDAQVRLDMIWDESRWDMELLGFYRMLIRTRRSQAAMRSGVRRLLHVDGLSQTWAFERRVAAGSDDLVVAAFNLSDAAQSIELPAEHASIAPLVATGKAPELSSSSVRLEPMSAAILGAAK